MHKNKELFTVNLGILFTVTFEFQSENGVLGMGPFPLKEMKMRISSGKQKTITTLPGASFLIRLSFGDSWPTC
jgi:acyl CoA:acetate/3-ketoacid CoA transferase beta subunit